MKKLLALTLTVTLLFALASCALFQKEKDVWLDAVYTEDTTLGEGAKTFALELEVGEHLITFTINTDADTVGDALLALDLIAGEESSYGIYVKVVNGMEADYDKDQRYWALMINGEYAMSGVDTTEIEEGVVYRLVYAK